MSVNFTKFSKPLLIIFCLLAWTFFWQFPWQVWFDELRWIQIFIAMVLFIIPGGVVHLLLSASPVKYSGILTSGFVISITVVGVLGILARVLHLSFSFIYNSLFIFGGGAISYLCYSWNQKVRLDYKVNKNLLWQVGLILPVVIAVYLAAKLSIPPIIHDDDLSYNALLAYFRYADQLDFNGVVKHITTVRFWLAFWPLVEAIIANLSGMHGLLLTGVYLSPALSILSFLAIYQLGRIINLKSQYALIAVLAQIVSLVRLTGSSQPGLAFFNLFTQDKVAASFVLSLIVIGGAISFLKSPNKKNLILFGLGVLGLGFTHPTVLGMTAFTIGIYALLDFWDTRRWVPVGQLIVVLVIIMVPHFSLRFFEEEGRRVYSVEGDQYTIRDYKINPHRLRVLDNPKYYGIAPEILDGLPYGLFLTAGLLSLIRLRNSEAERYFAAALVFLGIAFVPYTGWLLGTVITPFHLWRIPRLLPFGLSMAYLLESVIKGIANKIEFFRVNESRIHNFAPITVSLILLAGTLYILPWANGNLAGRKPGFDLWYEQYIEIGDYLNSLETKGFVVIGGPDSVTNDILPSLSIDAKLVSFRNENPGPSTTIWNSLVGEETPLEERFKYLERYEVQYILLRGDVDWIEEINNSYPDKVKLLLGNKKLLLYEFNP
jgi:hypothetical protein